MARDRFRHEAFLYAGHEEFVTGTVPFVREAVEADEPVLVVVDQQKIDLMRAGLGDDANRVLFANMSEIGRNPARIIPAWRTFVAERSGGERRPIRGIGEPIWAGRSSAELVECQQHESLLNLAFAGTPGFWLMCPYDVASLAPEVVWEARRSHEFVHQRGALSDAVSPSYRGLDVDYFANPLPEPADPPEQLQFGPGQLQAVRELVRRHACRAGMAAGRTAELALAVNEVATNSLRHGGGWGVLRLWAEGGKLLCEVRDKGRIREPLVGRKRPMDDREGGRGLWIANQLCDLVQVRSTDSGTVIRLHMSTA